MKLIAPLVGAGLFAAYGSGSVVALDAATFLLAAAATTMVRVDEPPPRPREGSGLGHLFRTPELVWPMLGGTAAMFAAGLQTAAVFSLLDDGLHRSPEFLGVLSALSGAGSVLAGLLATRVTGVRAVVVGSVLVGVAAALRLTGGMPAVLAGCVLHGLGLGLAWAVVAVATLVQQRTPAALLGRVSATSSSVVFAAVPLSMAVGAWLVGLVDFRPIYAAAAVIPLVAALVVRARGGQARRFTARKAPAWPAADQME